MKNLEKIEQLVGLIDKLYTFANVTPENILLAKINAKKAYDEALAAAHSLQEDLKEETVEEIQTENQAGPTAFQVAQEVLAAAETHDSVVEALSTMQKGSRVREGYNAFMAARTALSAAIPHEDQNIMSMNMVPEADAVYVNSFTKRKETLKMVVGTNNDAYAVTVSEQGTHAISPVKYWTKATD